MPLPVRIYEAVRESLVLAFFGSLHIAAVGQHSHGTRRPVGDMQDVRTVLFASCYFQPFPERRAESRAGAGSSFLVAGRAPASLRPLRAWPLRTSCRITDVTVLVTAVPRTESTARTGDTTNNFVSYGRCTSGKQGKSRGGGAQLIFLHERSRAKSSFTGGGGRSFGCHFCPGGFSRRSVSGVARD